MALIDKYFQQNQARKVITVCNDTIVINGAQWTKQALIEAIEDLGETILQHKLGSKVLSVVEFNSIVARRDQLIRTAQTNGITVGRQFRTVGK